MICVKALGVSDIKRRVQEGYSNLEIQLGRDFQIISAEDYIQQLASIDNLFINSIHLPFMYDGSINIANFNHVGDIVEKAATIADYFGKKQGTIVYLVVHLGCSMKSLNNGLYNDSLYLMQKLLYKYQNIGFYLENSQLLNVENGDVCSNPVATASYHNVTRYIRDTFGTDRVLSLIDISHANATCNILRAVNSMDAEFPICTLEDYFKNGRELVGAIHLAKNMRVGNFARGDHGRGFKSSDEQDVKEVKTIISYIEKYCPSATPIIEVTEKDYHSCPDQYETYHICKRLLRGDRL